jgi:hypothetical protein
MSSKRKAKWLREFGLTDQEIIDLCLEDLIENEDDYGEYVLSPNVGWTYLAKVLSECSLERLVNLAIKKIEQLERMESKNIL